MIKKIKNSNYFKSVKWGFISILVTFLNQLVLVPVFLYYFDKKIFGIWLMLSTTVLTIRALNLGQLNYSANLLNLSAYSVNDSKYKEILNISFSSNIIMIIIQCIMLFVLCHDDIIKQIFDLSILEINILNLKWCLILYGFPRILYQFYNLYVLRLFEPIGKINYTIKYQTIGEFLEFLSLILACIIFKDIVMMCLFSLCSATLYSIWIHHIAKKNNLIYYCKITKNIIKEGFKQIKKSFYLTISFVIEKFIEIGLNFIVIFIYGIMIIPLFNTTRIVANSAVRISNIIAVPLMPKIQKDFTTSNINSIIRTFNLYWTYTSSVIFLGIILVIPFIELIFNKWIQYKIEFNRDLLLIIFCSILIQNFNVILIEYLKKTNHTKQILLINILKIVVITVVFYLSKSMNNYLGLGLGILLSEMLTTFVVLFIKRKVIILSLISKNLIFTILFSLSLLFFFLHINYIYILIFSILLLITKHYKYVISIIKNI